MDFGSVKSITFNKADFYEALCQKNFLTLLVGGKGSFREAQTSHLAHSDTFWLQRGIFVVTADKWAVDREHN